MLLQCVVDSMSTQKVLGFNDLLGNLYTRSTRTVQRLHIQASEHASEIEDRGKSHFMEDVVLGPNGDKNLESTKGWPHGVKFFRSPNPRTFGNSVSVSESEKVACKTVKHTKLIDPLIRPCTCLDFIVRGNLVFCCLCMFMLFNHPPWDKENIRPGMPKSMPQQFGHRLFLREIGARMGQVHRDPVDGICHIAALNLGLEPFIKRPIFMEVVMLKGSVPALVNHIGGQNTQILHIQLLCQLAGWKAQVKLCVQNSRSFFGYLAHLPCYTQVRITSIAVAHQKSHVFEKRCIAL